MRIKPVFTGVVSALFIGVLIASAQAQPATFGTVTSPALIGPTTNTGNFVSDVFIANGSNGVLSVTPNFKSSVSNAVGMVTNVAATGIRLWQSTNAIGNGATGKVLYSYSVVASCPTNESNLASSDTNGFFQQGTLFVTFTNGIATNFVVGASNSAGAMLSGVYASNTLGVLYLYGIQPGTQPTGTINTIVNEQNPQANFGH